MELYVLEILLGHTQHITAVGKEDIASVLVLCHILVLALLEVLKLSLVVAFYPACFVQVDRFPTALGVILVFKTVLDNLKLQLSDSADDFASVELVDKQLCHTFVHKLVYAFLKLFRFHRVIILYILEQFR